MRWAALIAIAGVVIGGCGDSGATKEELHAAYEHGFSAGEGAGRFYAESDAEEERETGYEEGFEADEAEELEDLEEEIEAEERCERYDYCYP